MLFNSLQFLIFFPVVLVVYFLLPRKLKNLGLLVSSYYFYMCWNAKYIILIFVSTIITYLSGIAIHKINLSESCGKMKQKLVVMMCILINLGILFFYKYSNFAIDILCRITNVLHIDFTFPKVDILLPVGISFYTFQALSYTIDVYRKEIPAEKNFIEYALFVSFFPQLVAGPIERSKSLLSQLKKPHKFDHERFGGGMLLILWGYFLKIVIADRIAIFVDTVYADRVKFGGVYLAVATFLFAFQIYCDFSGYSTIAMGTAKILGISLMDNFNAPYISENVSTFWRRWHISLTNWFKDYLYIPLGGNKKGTVRKHINRLIVFSASGLWHGAQFSFVAWGGINGLYQVIGELLMPARRRIVQALHLNTASIGHKLLKIIVTFMLIDFSWIFFRANSFLDAIEIVKSIVGAKNYWVLFDGSIYTCGLDIKNFWLAIFSIMILLFADYCKMKGIIIREVILKQDWWFRAIFIVAAICFLLLFGKYGPAFDKASFIYFQF